MEGHRMRSGWVRAAWVVLLLVLAAVFSPARAQTAQTPEGVWRTTDDKTGQPKGEVRVYEQGGHWFAQITRVYDSKDAQSRCDDCQDERKGQPIVGLTVVRNMTLTKGEYQGGDILDPDTGKVYRCRLRLEDGGEKLVVRGFIGFSLLGRTQTWTRVH